MPVALNIPQYNNDPCNPLESPFHPRHQGLLQEVTLNRGVYQSFPTLERNHACNSDSDHLNVG